MMLPLTGRIHRNDRRKLEEVCRGPASPFGLRRGSLRYERACRAEAGEAREGWWSQAGSNRRPRHCERRALPAELWPRRGRLDRGGRPTIGAIYNPRQGQVKNGRRTGFFGAFLQGTSLVYARWNRYLAVGPI